MKPIPIFDIGPADRVVTGRAEAIRLTWIDGFCADVKTGAFTGYRPAKRLVTGRWRPRR